MQKNNKKLFKTTLFSLLSISSIISINLVTSSVAYADSGVLYRWVDSSGHVVFSDQIDPRIQGRVDVLSNKTGFLKKSIATTEEQAQQQVAAQQMAKQKLDEELQKKHDLTLLNNYSSLGDIQKARDFDLTQIDRSIKADLENLAAMKDANNRLSQQNQKSLVVQEAIDKNNANMAMLQKSIDKNRELYVQKQTQYQTDEKRLSELLSLNKVQSTANMVGEANSANSNNTVPSNSTSNTNTSFPVSTGVAPVSSTSNNTIAPNIQ